MDGRVRATFSRLLFRNCPTFNCIYSICPIKVEPIQGGPFDPSQVTPLMFY